mgnify:CR=1 FL=1
MKKRINKRTEQAMAEAMKLACIAKNNGHDLFVKYWPNTNQIELDFYLNGWGYKAENHAYHMISIDSLDAPENPAATIREAMTRIRDLILDPDENTYPI